MAGPRFSTARYRAMSFMRSFSWISGRSQTSQTTNSERHYRGLLGRGVRQWLGYCLKRVLISNRGIGLVGRHYRGLLRGGMRQWLGYCLKRVLISRRGIGVVRRHYYGLLGIGVRQWLGYCLKRVLISSRGIGLV